MGGRIEPLLTHIGPKGTVCTARVQRALPDDTITFHYWETSYRTLGSRSFTATA